MEGIGRSNMLLSKRRTKSLCNCPANSSILVLEKEREEEEKRIVKSASAISDSF
jgi:hypothetical protein